MLPGPVSIPPPLPELLSLPDGSPLADGSPSHCACVTLRRCRQQPMRHNDRSIFNHGGKKRRKPVLSKHDHLFKNEEDGVTVDKTDEVEDQKVSPQFRFEGYVE